MSLGRRALTPPLIVLAVSLVVFAVVNPPLVFTANTPSGGDMGAHVFGPAFMRDVLIPAGRIHGWSNDWFAGFPLYYFYFPLPALLIVALDVLLPYGVAFKLVAISGLLILPSAVFSFIRAASFDRLTAALAAAASLPFMLMESFKIYGGNVASTMAGEYAYVLSFSLGMFFLAALIKTLKTDESLAPVAAVLLAATALSHVLTTIVLIPAALAAIRGRRQLRLAVGVGAGGFAITAFWSIPFITRIRFSTDMAWVPLRKWGEVFPLEIWLLLPLALIGAVWATSRSRRIIPLVVATLIPVLYYPIPLALAGAFPDVFGETHWKLWNGRLLPYWYFGVTILAALAIAAGVAAISRRVPEQVSGWVIPTAIGTLGLVTVVFLRVSPLSDRVPASTWWMTLIVVVFLTLSYALAVGLIPGWTVSFRAFLTGTVAAIFVLGSLGAMNYASGWARWNFRGYEGKEQFGEYLALMTVIDNLPEGRVMWEHNREAIDVYGTSMALMLIPYWTGSSHPSMEGLFFESSLTVPFHFLNQAEMSFDPSQPVPGLSYRKFDFDRGIPHLRTYGVRYYVAVTEEAKTKAAADDRLVPVAESPPFQVYELVGFAPIVEVASHEVSVLEHSEEPFGEVSLDWYGRIELLDRWLVEDGPESWARVDSIDEISTTPRIVSEGEVSEIVIGEEEISFHTTAVGVPHLVKVSYFPNWMAEGAKGPFRAAPSLMVVVPTGEDVTLRFENTWVEATGNAVSGVGIVVALGWWFAWRRRRPA